jgi:hypothetical protein
MRKAILGITGCMLAILLIAAAGGERGPQDLLKKDLNRLSTSPLNVEPDFGRMPLYFIPNRGQMDERVAYYVQGKDRTLYFTPEGITFALAVRRRSKPFRFGPGDHGDPGSEGSREQRTGRSRALGGQARFCGGE